MKKISKIFQEAIDERRMCKTCKYFIYHGGENNECEQSDRVVKEYGSDIMQYWLDHNLGRNYCRFFVENKE